MVMLYVGGIKVGDLANAATLLPELVAKNQTVDFRDENGNHIGTFKPELRTEPREPLVPWDATITREELDRRLAEPGLTIDEVRERMGWK